MWTYLLGPLLALLPERWRKAYLADAPVNWPRAGLISGLVEGVGCLLALIGWYLYFIQVAVDQQAALTAGALLTQDPPKGATGAGLSYAMGLSALAAFVMHPLTWLLAYFAVEGTLRTFAALLTDEVTGTLPLALVDRGVTRARRRAYEARVPLVADAVSIGEEKDPWDLKVESCRPKPTWKYPLTVRFKEAYFQVAGETSGEKAARPHAYLLRRPPPGEAYRGVVDYDPEDVLRPEEKQPHFLVVFFRALGERYRVWRLPLVADAVERGDGSRGWDLKIEACRPKSMWIPPRTIRFEDRLYKVQSIYQAAPPRPFGYLLRFLPRHEAARGVLNYSPDEPVQG